MVAKPPFEKALADLEKIIQELESGDLALEKAIKKFEQGMQLSKYCEKTLDETEKRIAVIMKGSAPGDVKETPFDDTSENET